MSERQYPECNKLRSLSQERAVISDFLEWLRSNNRWICESWGTFGRFDAIHESDDSLIMRFLEIDPVKLEEERREMLAALQEPELTCEHPKDLYAPHCTDISCPNYAGRFQR